MRTESFSCPKGIVIKFKTVKTVISGLSLKKTLILLIDLYRSGLSPFFGHSCRFTPTCSQYMIDAIEKYGPARGLLKGLYRILRCWPLFPGGYDPA